MSPRYCTWLATSVALTVGLVGSGSPLTVPDIGRAVSPSIGTVSRAGSIFESLSVSFEANVGQAGPEVRFLSRNRAYTLLLTTSGLVFVFRGRPGPLDSAGFSLATFEGTLPGNAANGTYANPFGDRGTWQATR